jgi:hypothetical protein
MIRQTRDALIIVALAVLLAASLRVPGSLAYPSAALTYVPGSTQEVCQLTGLANKTPAQEYGLLAADRGYSFVHQGKLWFLFGDAQPTKFFPQRGPHNNFTDNTHNRWGPSSSTSNLDNDAIAFAAQTPAGTCPNLQFIKQTSPAVGAFASPSLAYDGKQVPLRTNEAPFSGIDVKGNAYVLFGTNNPQDTNTPETCRETGNLTCLGSPLTTVLARLDKQDQLQFTGLYTFSGPAPGEPLSRAGRFIQVAMAPGPDGYLYFFGTTGGPQVAGAQPCGAAAECYRHSYVRLARMLPQDIENGANGRPAGIEYWVQTTENPGLWKRADESEATPLFREEPPCMGELGVEYNADLHQWMMLFNCKSAQLGGIQLRMAPSAEGPWSPPQTIFNAARDKGLCYYIHSQNGKNCPPGAPNPPEQNPGAQTGGDYGPYFIAGWTTNSRDANGVVTTTFYYTLDTFVPYGQVILKSTIAGKAR